MASQAGIDSSFWRAIAVFRIASLAYAALLLAGADGYQRPLASWLVFAAMAGWTAVSALAWSVHGGRRAGIAAAVALAAVDTWRRGLEVTFPSNGVVLLLLTAVAVGRVSRLARRAEEQLRQAARSEAASQERERLARRIHDSVLQVLAMVQRRGSELGGPAAELGLLAGEQETALRNLARGDHTGTPAAPDSSASGVAQAQADSPTWPPCCAATPASR
jgi:signal transduction histidine kinase